MTTLDRGFKSWSERAALSLRRDLNVTVIGRVDPFDIAAHIGVALWTPRDVPELPENIITQLLETDPWSWSAVGLVHTDSPLVIYNPRHSAARRASTIMHELAHVLLEHVPGKVVLSADGTMAVREHDSKQEEEANWLAGAVLAPRDGLIELKARPMTSEAIAETYGISKSLVDYRLRMTGVESQLRARRGSVRRK